MLTKDFFNKHTFVLYQLLLCRYQKTSRHPNCSEGNSEDLVELKLANTSSPTGRLPIQLMLNVALLISVGGN